MTTSQIGLGLTTVQVAVMETADVASLTTAQVVALSTEQVAALTTAQVASGFTTAQLAAMETRDVAALTTRQVLALTTAQLAQGLTTAQFAGLTTTQIAAFSTAQIAGGLTTYQVATLSVKQVKALTTAQVAQGLTTAQIAAITTADVAVLTTAQVAAMTTAQVAQGLTTDQIVALTAKQVAAMTTAQVGQGLTTAQLAAMEVSDLAAMTTAQIVALTTSQISEALSVTQVAGLSTAQVAAMTTTQIASGLSGTQLAAMTDAQLSAMTTAQVCAVTDTQLESLSLEQIDLFGTITPIALDLNGDGIRTLSIAAGVQFDIAADGTAAHTGWVSKTDGLLVMDRNADGAINDGSELFGSSTTLLDGTKAKDGYAALSELDTNHDGMLSSADAGFAKLQVWVDVNSDGVSNADELKSLADLNISNISVVAERNISKDNGNIVGLTSSYQTTDGASHAAADVWFVTDAAKTSVAPAIHDSAADMSNRVSDLVKAIGQFDSSAPAASASRGMGQAVSAHMDAGLALNFAGVGSMVDLLKQFDAHGKFAATQPLLGAAPVTPLKAPKFGDLPENGQLASSVLAK
jgi:hypothetical protein